MQLHLTLTLPKEALSVPVARHLCLSCLGEMGVDYETAADVELALSEACSNVVRHAHNGDSFEVNVAIVDGACDIRVIDRGGVFELGRLGATQTELADSGRGVELMRALMDKLNFVSEPGVGTIVHLSKHLDFHATNAAASGVN